MKPTTAFYVWQSVDNSCQSDVPADRMLAPTPNQVTAQSDAPTTFFEKTTISGLHQIHFASNICAKVLWMLLFGTGLAIAIYQAWTIMEQFLRFSVIEKSRIELKSSMDFPDVTICSNVQFYQSNRNDDQVNPVIKQLYSDLNASMATSGALDSDDIINIISRYSYPSRKALGIPLQHFVASCQYGNVNCREDLVIIHNLKYGNCVTFNPQNMKNNSSTPIDQNKQLRMVLKIHKKVEYTDESREDANIFLAVHQHATAPILSQEKLIKLFLDERLEINIAKRMYIRSKPWPYQNDCVDSNSSAAQWLSLYHQHQTPYLYSMEACVDSCLQNLTLKYCNCFLSRINVPRSFQNVKACKRDCTKIPINELENVCGCKKTCQNEDHKMTLYKRIETFKDDTTLQNSLNQHPTEEILIQNLTRFSLEIITNLVEVISEELQNERAAVVGSIGGIFGLWIGLSIMSIFEILWAFSKVIGKFLK